MQTSKLKSFRFSQNGNYLVYHKVMAILKFQFAYNYSVNLNFDLKNLGNARMDLNLFVFWSSFIYIKTGDLMFTSLALS